jgi:hypothetical protein
MSSGQVCDRELRVTYMKTMLPLTPDTITSEGYGAAGPDVPLPGIEILVKLLKRINCAIHGVAVIVAVRVTVGVFVLVAVPVGVAVPVSVAVLVGVFVLVAVGEVSSKIALIGGRTDVLVSP